MAITFIAVSLNALEPTASETLAYQRQLALLEPWRMLTANFCHTNDYHLIFNLAGLWLLSSLFRLPLMIMFSLVLITSIAVTSGLLLFSPQVSWYVGLSGTLHGIFAYGACHDIKQRVKFGWLLLAGLIIKLSYEHIYPSAWMTELIEANVMTMAHVYGAIAGVACFLLMHMAPWVRLNARAK